MNTIDKVRQFHETFNHPIAKQPTEATVDLRVLRARLIAEELGELCEALGLDFHYDIDSIQPNGDPVNLVEVADALGDLDYVVQGANLVFGIPAEAVLNEIHESNMSKLGPDGKPIYDEYGKVIKGPNYFKPDIAEVLKWCAGYNK